MTKRLSIALIASAATTSGCAVTTSEAVRAPAPATVALLRTSEASERGRATVTATRGGVRVTLNAIALPPGPHALHIHTVGRCDAPDFTTAGPHWNPDMKAHGRDNPAGAHRGDLPNVVIGRDGRGSVSFDLPATAAALLEGEGKAIIIHAAADDYRTDPSGNSGARVACGVFVAG